MGGKEHHEGSLASVKGEDALIGGNFWREIDLVNENQNELEKFKIWILYFRFSMDLSTDHAPSWVRLQYRSVVIIIQNWIEYKPNEL